jgi:hypothetical protein
MLSEYKDNPAYKGLITGRCSNNHPITFFGRPWVVRDPEAGTAPTVSPDTQKTCREATTCVSSSRQKEREIS